ncbi:MAG: type II toxin-antitoxin system mRNA interferase toxin, RelE/StbE family [Nitrospirae bacterium]|nr:MAG: type II toxin-antitoxin system mRNA interferase toxin, RelE/StbE family [Nitrospirota bacterium]
MYTLHWTAYFTRAAKKFAKQHPELKKNLAEILRDLEEDPFQPHLDLHSLGGKLKDIKAVSLTYKYRIVLTVIVTDKEVTLLDIGSHDEVYR